MFKLGKKFRTLPVGLTWSDCVILRILFIVSGIVFLIFMSSTVLAVIELNPLFAGMAFMSSTALAYFLVLTKSLLYGIPRVIHREQFFVSFFILVLVTQASWNTLFLSFFGIIWLHGLVLLSFASRLGMAQPDTPNKR